MTIDPASEGATNLVERIKSVLMTPQAAFDRIATEPADIGKLYTGYVLPLAAAAALATFIGTVFIGVSAFGVTARTGLIPGAVNAVLQVAFAVGGVYVMALVANALAPNFGSQQDVGQAHKLAAYSSTAGFIAGLFMLLPPLAILGIVGLYSLALLYIGLPRLMKTPEDKRVPYFLTILVVCIVVGIVAGMLMGSIAAATNGLTRGFGQSAQTQQAATQDTVTLPGGGTINLNELEKLGQAYSQGGEAPAAIDPARLQGYMPTSLPGGFSLVGSSTNGAMGAAGVEGQYQNGSNAELRVTIVHMGAMGGLASMAGAMNVTESHQDANGYRRVNTVDGRLITEEASTSGGTVSYAVIGQGVAVTVEGSNGATIDQARAAVETIGVQRLEGEFRG